MLDVSELLTKRQLAFAAHTIYEMDRYFTHIVEPALDDQLQRDLITNWIEVSSAGEIFLYAARKSLDIGSLTEVRGRASKVAIVLTK